MIEPIVIWRAANEVIKRHGDMAPIECAMSADELLDNGDEKGRKMWLAIHRAAKSLLENGCPTDINKA